MRFIYPLCFYLLLYSVGAQKITPHVHPDSLLLSFGAQIALLQKPSASNSDTLIISNLISIGTLMAHTTIPKDTTLHLVSQLKPLVLQKGTYTQLIQTHVLAGNIYLQTGHSSKALENYLPALQLADSMPTKPALYTNLMYNIWYCLPATKALRRSHELLPLCVVALQKKQ